MALHPYRLCSRPVVPLVAGGRLGHRSVALAHAVRARSVSSATVLFVPSKLPLKHQLALAAAWCLAAPAASAAPLIVDDGEALPPAALLPAAAIPQPQPKPPARTEKPKARSTALQAQADAQQQIELEADRLSSTLQDSAQAEGNVSLKQGGLELTAEALKYNEDQQLVTATGLVTLRTGGDSFSGREMQVNLATREGYVTEPTYWFAETGAGGTASRIDFRGTTQLTARDATYTSCPRDGSGDPDWLLSADRVEIDMEKNEGRAHGAVLRFLGVPILAAPALTFPVTEDRKSGWLPPTLSLDSRSGFNVSVPFYWNIAPEFDATFAPGFSTKRGSELEAEFRYLQPSYTGLVQLHTVPNDRQANRSRSSMYVEHLGEVGSVRYDLVAESASDDDYWKDFSGKLPSLTPRLLSRAAHLRRDVERELSVGQFGFSTYAAVQDWQVLQDSESGITSPYRRMPQLGVVGSLGAWSGIQTQLQLEYNRFQLGDRLPGDDRPEGDRTHALLTVARPWTQPWGWLTPALTVNTASYHTDTPMADGSRSASRTIPTVSLDTGLRLDRTTTFFGQSARQTLEPRIRYVRTPYRDQANLPAFDTAALDFNEVSIYADNPFAGIDRVADVDQITVGATSRWVDAEQGNELLSLGVAQRFQFRDQRITPDGLPPSSRVSDVLVFGSGNILPPWRLEASVQYNTDIQRTVRSIISTRYNPAPFHTVSLAYRYARGLSEQVELGWQWPIYRGVPGGNGCGGSLYGVGRVNYSLPDNSVPDAVLGVEYDAGCWIGRVVAERLSTGRSESTTRVMIQLELIGLSRLGTNPLKTLKDNIPGYQLLRDDSGGVGWLNNDD